MKKLFYFLSAFSLAALMTVGCQEEEVKESSISLDNPVVEADFHLASSSVTVTSSGEWSLDGEYGWIEPSVRSGKTGDKVEFSVGLNTTGKTRAAVFTFRCEDKSAKYALRQTSGDFQMTLDLSVVSATDSEVRLGLSASSNDYSLFKSWGVRYGESRDELKNVGEDYLLEGGPSAGNKEVAITGLKPDVMWYFAAWAATEDGVRVYSDIAEAFTGSAFESNLAVSVKARSAGFTFDLKLTGVKAAGVCWSSDGAPTIDGDKIEIENPSVGTVEFNTLDSGKVLAADKSYRARAYIVRSNGDVVYDASVDLVTMSDPFDNWLTDNNFANDYKHFRSLCEYGPVRDGNWGSVQSVVESASARQTEFRNVWNTALTTYATGKHYASMFSEMVFLQSDGKNVMQNLVWREGSVGEGLPKEANTLGGFSYIWTRDADGFLSFASTGFAYVPADSWVVRKQGMTVDEISKVWSTAANKSQFELMKDYWTQHKFLVDWGKEVDLDGQIFNEIMLYPVDSPKDAFCFSPFARKVEKYDPVAYEIPKDEPIPEGDPYLWISDGVNETRVALTVEGDGYYLRYGSSLAGKKVRISTDSETGYPAYVPSSDGKCVRIDNASGMYTVPVANKWANKCAISFSVSGDICIIRDIFIISDTMSIVGDCIDLTGTTISSDWNAWENFSWFKSKDAFFAPDNKLKEPHIYRFTTSFKNVTEKSEGFKIIGDGGWSLTYVATVNGIDPVNTWCDVNYSKMAEEDFKWKPNVTGEWTVELDANAMKLRLVKKN